MLTSLDFLAAGKPWPPSDEARRLSAYRENILLRSGKFEDAWPDLVEYLRKGKTQKGVGFCLDYPAIITQKVSDLIIGEPPAFCLPVTDDRAENPDEKLIDALTDRINFIETLDALIANVDSLGDGVLKVIQGKDGLSKILNISPCHWFPVIKRGTDEILYHVLCFKFEEEERCYLEVEIHGANDQGVQVIEHRLYELNESATHGSATLGKQLPWENANVKEIDPNPTGDFLIFTAHNKSDGIFGKSNYSQSLKDILKKLIIRYALENDVLDTFTRPTFFGPKEYQDLDPITKKPVFRPGGYIGLNPDPGSSPILPGGLVWDAHLGDNDTSKKSLMDRLFDVSEMSPVLFAGNLAGMAESGTALRLRLTNTLSKCNRIKRKIAGPCKKAINAALQLEGNVLEGMYIEWGSNLPRLPLEEAQRFMWLAAMPQFEGEVGSQYLLKELGYSEKEAKAIMSDPTRMGAMGNGLQTEGKRQET